MNSIMEARDNLRNQEFLILGMSESLNFKGYAVTVDVQKAFDSLSHSFLLACLKKYGYGNDFVKWVEMLLRVLHD